MPDVTSGSRYSEYSNTDGEKADYTAGFEDAVAGASSDPSKATNDTMAYEAGYNDGLAANIAAATPTPTPSPGPSVGESSQEDVDDAGTTNLSRFEEHINKLEEPLIGDEPIEGGEGGGEGAGE